MADHWLAFDIGTTGAKVAVIDAHGQTLHSAYRSYETRTAGGWLEQNAADWWQAVLEAVHELDASDRSTITAIALTGQMQDLILLNAHGTPIRPVMLYSDTRAQAEADVLNAQIGADRLRALTGNTQDGSSLLAKLRWLMEHEPDTLPASATLLFGAADYIALKLTGAATTDTTTASTTGLLDLTRRVLLTPDLLAEMQLADIIPLLPDVHHGGAHIGTLTVHAANVLKLPRGIPVYHGPGDAGATTFGAGSGEPGHAYGYVGTSGWIGFTAAAGIPQASGIFTLAHARSEQVITIAPLLTAGGNLDWLHELFDAGDHADLIARALDRPPTELLYLPYLNGERSPFSDPFARGAFIGLMPQHRREDLCRAALEGVVYAYRHALDALMREPVGALTLTGGGTRSRGWCQLFADIIGLPVTLTDDATNVGGRGAVLAARVAGGTLPNYAPSSFFPVTDTLAPHAAYRVHYDHRFTLFKAAYLALKPIFAELHSLTEKSP
ncbi:MAG: xylulokinase [Aggregatilineales bacterium]